MKKSTPFKKVVLCHTNDFKPDLNDKIKVWVESNGGKFLKDITHEVTHLVASKKAWKKYHPLVKQARRLRTVHIVKYDWLEDSLLSHPLRALPVEEYLHERTKIKPIQKAQRRTEAASLRQSLESNKITVPRDKRIEIQGLEFDKARKDFEQDMACVGFHPYSDNTGFVYIITLLRYDILKSRFEKYRLKVGHEPPAIPHDVTPNHYTKLYLFPAPEAFSSTPVIGFSPRIDLKYASCIHIAEPWAQCLQLYESDDEPHTYACYAQYTRPGVQKQVRVLAPPGATWTFAWDIFEKFFLQKVGTEWNKRSSTEIAINLDNKLEMNLFRYQPPKLGEPEGLRVTKHGKPNLI